jgi:hypothetical protein
MDVGKSSVTVDNRTGLVWMTDGNFWGSSTTWANAITRCQNLNTGVYAGYTDWRLPNVRELMTIIQCGAYGPAIDSANFRNTQNLYYWSSTTHATTATSAWCVYFLRGSVNYFGKTSYYYVRAVRGGP